MPLPSRLVVRTLAAVTVSLQLMIASASARAQGIERPAGWRAIVDGGAGDTVSHTPMPPGWHVTTGPGAILFDPAYRASGRYTVEAEIFLFPGTSQSGYGLFVGGRSLDASARTYLAFVIRRDGQSALEYTTNGVTRALIPWGASPAVKPHPGNDDTVLNAIALTVDRDSIVVEANGKRVGSAPRGDLDLDGTFGFRVGADVNLHASRLDLRTRLAPVPNRKK